MIWCPLSLAFWSHRASVCCFEHHWNQPTGLAGPFPPHWRAAGLSPPLLLGQFFLILATLPWIQATWRLAPDLTGRLCCSANSMGPWSTMRPCPLLMESLSAMIWAGWTIRVLFWEQATMGPGSVLFRPSLLWLGQHGAWLLHRQGARIRTKRPCMTLGQAPRCSALQKEALRKQGARPHGARLRAKKSCTSREKPAFKHRLSSPSSRSSFGASLLLPPT